MPCFLSLLHSNQGPFPLPALPEFIGALDLSATQPARPVSHGIRLMRPHHRQGFVCCHIFHLPCMLVPVPRRKRIGAQIARFPVHRRPSPGYRRVSFCLARFEACTGFTNVPAGLLAEPPQGDPLTPRRFNLDRCLCESSWLLPTEARSVGWDSHPPGKRAFPVHGALPILGYSVWVRWPRLLGQSGG